MNCRTFRHLSTALLMMTFGAGCETDHFDRMMISGTRSSTSGIAEDLSAGLRGVDADANNIRDDIDRLIEEKFSQTPEVKKAAEQDARATQLFMEANTREEALIAAEQLGRSSFCIGNVLPDSDGDFHMRVAISKEIEAWTAKTKKRLNKYLDSNRLVGGAYFVQPVQPVCD